MQLRSKYFLLFAVSLLASAKAIAQSGNAVSTPGHQEMDLAVTYTEQYSNLVSTPTFWHSGGSVEFSTQLYHGFGLAANATGTQIDSSDNHGIGLSLVTVTFGPRYTWYHPIGAEKKHSLAIYGQGLLGQGWGFNSYFPSPTGVQTDSIALALQVGGGVDVGLSRHFGIRAFQADWVRTQFPNATTDVQNTLRLAAGVVFRFGQKN
jgi:peptidoglycan-associated lipoprotein